MSDYRITSDCVELQISIKKDDLSQKLQIDRPRKRNHYRLFSEEISWKRMFTNVYNRRCAYCGLEVRTSDIKLFEIDHFFCLSKYEDYKDLNNLNNLVFSCMDCNRKKGDFAFPDMASANLLFPDNQNYDAFYRSNDFYIKITPKYQNNTVVQSFFSKLELGAEEKRIDYLLIKIEKMNDKLKRTELYEIYNLLRELRSDFKSNYEIVSENITPKERTRVIRRELVTTE